MRTDLLWAWCLLLCACAATPDSPTGRALVQSWEDGLGGEQAVVPTTVPDGYRLVFAPGHFRPPPGSAGIAVCTLPLGQDPVGICVGTADDSPWFSTTTVEGDRQAVVETTTGGATERDLDPWRTVRYTSDLEGVDWLDDRLDP